MDRFSERRNLATTPPELDRRTLLKLMGASLSLAGLVGCSGQADENALPFVEQPENLLPGIARWYATAVTFAGYAQPVWGKTFTGRPVKLEGNPDHPASAGKSSAQTQAALLHLYDPHRSRAPVRQGQPSTWDAFQNAAFAMASELDRSGGEGFRLLTGPTSSPTLIRQIDAMRARWPRLRWHGSAGGLSSSPARATADLFGLALEIVPDFSRAELVVAFDDDFLGTGPRQTINAFAFGLSRSRRQEKKGPFGLIVAESIPSMTGAMADRRISVADGEAAILLHALAARLGVDGVAGPSLSGAQQAFIDTCAARLQQAGKKALVSVGACHSPDLIRLGLLINDRLGSLGETVAVADPVLADPGPGGDLAALADDLKAGKVRMLVCLESNPLYEAAGDSLAQALKAVPLTIHAGRYADETAALCHWHLPLEHDLETWSDARAVDGSVCLLQPLVRPFFDVRSRHVFLDMLMRGGSDGRSIVQATWKPQWNEAFEARWQAALYAGVVADSRPAIRTVPVANRALKPLAVEAPAAALVAHIRPDPTVWDGSFSENAWMQELPKPLSKVTWENVIRIGSALAARHGLKSGDLAEVSAHGRQITGPVFVSVGQSASVIELTLGYGRRLQNGIAHGLGYDPAPLRDPAEPWVIRDIGFRPLGQSVALATTQPEQDMAGFDFAREVSHADQSATAGGPQQGASFYPEKPHPSPSWAMAIDLDLCIGCNACVTACQAENNIPVVGKALVAQGREMQWMRVDLYHSGAPEAPRLHFQPVPCMHCEDAPCEMGCPVNAAVHSTDGLNLQVYNRCIGTRTCSSFCPYKVRRFNWFDYTGGDDETLQAMRNPDVTVRSRGVMEKCTYCVQRIQEARIRADKEDRGIREGEVVTACQQACPSQAITFGNLADPASAVSRKRASPRHYVLLEEANTRPRTTYLARIAEEQGKEGA